MGSVLQEEGELAWYVAPVAEDAIEEALEARVTAEEAVDDPTTADVDGSLLEGELAW